MQQAADCSRPEDFHTDEENEAPTAQVSTVLIARDSLLAGVQAQSPLASSRSPLSDRDISENKSSAPSPQSSIASRLRNKRKAEASSDATSAPASAPEPALKKPRKAPKSSASSSRRRARLFELLEPLRKDPLRSHVFGAGLRFCASNTVIKPMDIISATDGERLILIDAFSTGNIKPKLRCRVYSDAKDSVRVLAPSSLQPGSTGKADAALCKRAEAALQRLLGSGTLRQRDNSQDSASDDEADDDDDEADDE
jgi:hypothetical protein